MSEKNINISKKYKTGLVSLGITGRKSNEYLDENRTFFLSESDLFPISENVNEQNDVFKNLNKNIHRNDVVFVYETKDNTSIFNIINGQNINGSTNSVDFKLKSKIVFDSADVDYYEQYTKAGSELEEKGFVDFGKIFLKNSNSIEYQKEGTGQKFKKVFSYKPLVFLSQNNKSSESAQDYYSIINNNKVIKDYNFYKERYNRNNSDISLETIISNKESILDFISRSGGKDEVLTFKSNDKDDSFAIKTSDGSKITFSNMYLSKNNETYRSYYDLINIHNSNVYSSYVNISSYKDHVQTMSSSDFYTLNEIEVQNLNVENLFGKEYVGKIKNFQVYYYLDLDKNNVYIQNDFITYYKNEYVFGSRKNKINGGEVIQLNEEDKGVLNLKEFITTKSVQPIYNIPFYFGASQENKKNAERYYEDFLKGSITMNTLISRLNALSDVEENPNQPVRSSLLKEVKGVEYNDENSSNPVFFNITTKEDDNIDEFENRLYIWAVGYYDNVKISSKLHRYTWSRKKDKISEESNLGKDGYYYNLDYVTRKDFGKTDNEGLSGKQGKGFLIDVNIDKQYVGDYYITINYNKESDFYVSHRKALSLLKEKNIENINSHVVNIQIEHLLNDSKKDNDLKTFEVNGINIPLKETNGFVSIGGQSTSKIIGYKVEKSGYNESLFSISLLMGYKELELYDFKGKEVNTILDFYSIYGFFEKNQIPELEIPDYQMRLKINGSDSYMYFIINGFKDTLLSNEHTLSFNMKPYGSEYLDSFNMKNALSNEVIIPFKVDMTTGTINQLRTSGVSYIDFNIQMFESRTSSDFIIFKQSLENFLDEKNLGKNEIYISTNMDFKDKNSDQTSKIKEYLRNPQNYGEFVYKIEKVPIQEIIPSSNTSFMVYLKIVCRDTNGLIFRLQPNIITYTFYDNNKNVLMNKNVDASTKSLQIVYISPLNLTIADKSVEEDQGLTSIRIDSKTKRLVGMCDNINSVLRINTTNPRGVQKLCLPLDKTFIEVTSRKPIVQIMYNKNALLPQNIDGVEISRYNDLNLETKRYMQTNNNNPLFVGVKVRGEIWGGDYLDLRKKWSEEYKYLTSNNLLTNDIKDVNIYLDNFSIYKGENGYMQIANEYDRKQFSDVISLERLKDYSSSGIFSDNLRGNNMNYSASVFIPNTSDYNKKEYIPKDGEYFRTLLWDMKFAIPSYERENVNKIVTTPLDYNNYAENFDVSLRVLRGFQENEVFAIVLQKPNIGEYHSSDDNIKKYFDYVEYEEIEMAEPFENLDNLVL